MRLQMENQTINNHEAPKKPINPEKPINNSKSKLGKRENHEKQTFGSWSRRLRFVFKVYGVVEV